LASNSFQFIQEAELKDVFIIDHHEITQTPPESINILNSELHENQKISASGLVYLFCKEINEEAKELAKLAILGMIGDQLEKEIDNLNNDILKDGEIKRKRGLLIYPSTRPINRTLEFSSNPYIPGVTGNIKGVLEMLRECGLNPKTGKYKTLLELDEQEMQNLITSIMLRNPRPSNRELIGDIFLIKLFNKLEDARELSAKINACSRMGRSDLALQLCLESIKAKKEAESIHAKYKQQLISGIKIAENTQEKSNSYIIINAKDKIKDTIIGTIISILSNSGVYEPGTIIIGLAQDQEKIKISARSAGKPSRNLRELLSNVMQNLEGEVGGHEHAAGCIISQEDQETFLENLRQNLKLEVVRI
jgi:RecJ-like exonuclease